MRVGNAVVAALLRSPLHPVLSGSTGLVRYTGRRSGRTVTTPTQCARDGDAVVILVGRPGRKTWWRNFADDRELDLLLQGRWTAMTGRAVVGADDPGRAARLLAAYGRRFPRAAARCDPTDVVLVRCRPR